MQVIRFSIRRERATCFIGKRGERRLVTSYFLALLFNLLDMLVVKISELAHLLTRKQLGVHVIYFPVNGQRRALTGNAQSKDTKLIGVHE